MDGNRITSTVAHRPGRRAVSRARLTPATLFAVSLLAFLLPFATVSCGEPVTFTGVELATARVAEDAQSSGEREFADEIEANGTVLALVALVAIAVGLGLAVVQLRGVGLAALVALLALLLLPWSAAAELDRLPGARGLRARGRRDGRGRRRETGRGSATSPRAGSAPVAGRSRGRAARGIDRRHGRALHRLGAIRLMETGWQ